MKHRLAYLNKLNFKKVLKILLLGYLAYIVFSFTFEITTRNKAEHAVKVLCLNIQKGASEQEVIKHMTKNDIVHSKLNDDSLSFATKNGLPETPTCSVYFKQGKVEHSEWSGHIYSPE